MERALALRDVMDHAVRVQREITDPSRLRRRNLRAIALTVLCVPLIALSAYSWIARPEVIWGPRGRVVPPLRSEAELRVAMFLLAQRLEAYRRLQGSYPKSLAAIDEDPHGIRYDVNGDSAFALSVTRDGKGIVLRSSDNAEAFLGNSVALIGGRRQ